MVWGLVEAYRFVSETIVPDKLLTLEELTKSYAPVFELRSWFIVGLVLLIIVMVEGSYRLNKDLQSEVDEQTKGKGLLVQLDRLKESWLYFIDNRPKGAQEFDQWKKDFAIWQGKVIPHTKNEPTWKGSFPHDHYDEEHLSLLHQGDILWKTLEAKINRLKTAYKVSLTPISLKSNSFHYELKAV